MSAHPTFVVQSGHVELTLAWRDDRYQQLLAAGDARRESELIKCLHSPVFTEVHQQGDLLFLSGADRDCHWSASIEPLPDGFLFDVACRVKAMRYGGIAAMYVGTGLAFEPAESGALAPRVEGSADGACILIVALEASRTQVTPPCTVRFRYRCTTATTARAPARPPAP
ncbi:hypothetical protein Pla175_51360 [Pirellulimonas nuda]|uniref:Uncharacterized protein n=1 Tax=Pirellulimonas nuda TaxID=2528009 RepID=A0A518DJT0_9BACT|nr:hypothetical protein [Pirellulimonas nuda]QDU91706.1 hypothetical protein Pla175_51360 [Pirellulimonas nuda]